MMKLETKSIVWRYSTKLNFLQITKINSQLQTVQKNNLLWMQKFIPTRHKNYPKIIPHDLFFQSCRLINTIFAAVLSLKLYWNSLDPC